MVKKIIKSLEKGIGFGLGLVLVFGILFSVYAFVEPTLNPSNNYVIDTNSKLLNNGFNNCEAIKNYATNNQQLTLSCSAGKSIRSMTTSCSKDSSDRCIISGITTNSITLYAGPGTYFTGAIICCDP